MWVHVKQLASNGSTIGGTQASKVHATSVYIEKGTHNLAAKATSQHAPDRTATQRSLTANFG